jgi:hypothetical protein
MTRTDTQTPSTIRRDTRLGRIAPLDRAVWSAAAALILAMIVVIALGDRVGVTLDSVSPLGTAHSTSRIVLQFSEQMDRPTVEPRLRFEPPITGNVTWAGDDTLQFRPDAPLSPRASYTAILEAGARAETGRELLSEYRFSFTVQPPRALYLAPADSIPTNVWGADPTQPDGGAQITFSPSGIYDYGVSADGVSIAFSETNSETGTTDIKRLNLETGALDQLTNCVNATCTTPVWRPDGTMIAYERVELDTGVGSGISPRRVWLLDLSSTPPTTRPLFNESQILGFDPQWSADGSRIAVFDPASGAILVYDFNTGNITGVPSRAGSSGALSPDGMRIAYPEVPIVDGVSVRPFIRIVDLNTGSQTDLGTPDDPYEDTRAVWHPDGTRLAVARRYLDDRYTRGYQIVLVDPETRAAEPLTEDVRYNNLTFWFDPLGTTLLMQRFPELDENMQPNALGRPEIWTLDLASRALTRVATNAFLPRWAP